MGFTRSGGFQFFFGVALALTLGYFLSDLGFVRKYNVNDLYHLFLGRQLDFFMARSFLDYLIGVGLEDYYEVAPRFEIAYLSYLSVSGLVFGVVNFLICTWFAMATICQLKAGYRDGSLSAGRLEMQVMNLLIVLSMLLSSIHFPVITNYLGSLIFMFHLGFGLYLLRLHAPAKGLPALPKNNF